MCVGGGGALWWWRECKYPSVVVVSLHIVGQSAVASPARTGGALPSRVQFWWIAYLCSFGFEWWSVIRWIWIPVNCKGSFVLLYRWITISGRCRRGWLCDVQSVCAVVNAMEREALSTQFNEWIKSESVVALIAACNWITILYTRINISESHHPHTPPWIRRRTGDCILTVQA